MVLLVNKPCHLYFRETACLPGFPKIRKIMDPDPGSGSRLGSGFRIQKRIQSHSNKSGCLVFMIKIFWFQIHFQFSTASFGYTIQCYCGAWFHEADTKSSLKSWKYGQNLPQNSRNSCLLDPRIRKSWIRISDPRIRPLWIRISRIQWEAWLSHAKLGPRESWC